MFGRVPVLRIQVSLIFRLLELLVEFEGNLLSLLTRYHMYSRLLLTFLGLKHTRRLMDITSRLIDILGRSVLRLHLFTLVD